MSGARHWKKSNALGRARCDDELHERCYCVPGAITLPPRHNDNGPDEIQFTADCVKYLEASIAYARV
jgi:hypothetical protein